MSALVSLILGLLVFFTAIVLGLWQYREAHQRPPGLTLLDQKHFARQDLRRATCTLVLLILAVALIAGGRMEPRVDDRPNLQFVQLWAGVAFLIVVLSMLAMLDFISTRIYARRLRSRLTEEGLDLIEAEVKVRMLLKKSLPDTNGKAHHPDLHGDIW
jgi:hypothetical protein